MARGKGLARHTARLEEEEGPDCPLCIEPLDAHEQDWYPCTCGYQVCAFCYQRLQLENNNQCPGCRTEYGTRKEPLQKSEGRNKASPAKPNVRASPKHAANGLLSPRSKTESTPNGIDSSPAANGTANVKGASRTPNGQLAIQQTSAPAKQTSAGLDSYPEGADDSGESSSGAANESLVQNGDTGGGGSTRIKLGDPHVAQANPAADLEPTASSSGEAMRGSQLAATGGLGRTTNWAGRKAAGSDSANLQASVASPSPSKWPELGSTDSAANSAGLALDLATDPPPPPPRQSQPGASGQQQQQQPQASPGGLARLIHSGSGDQLSAAGALWRQLLPRTTPETDPQGSALREAITTAVQSGKLSSREGARQLVAYLAMVSKHRGIGAAKAAAQQAEAQLQQQQEQQQQQQQQREKQQAELEHLQQLLQRQQLQEQQAQQSVSSRPAQEERASGAAQQRSWLTEGIKLPGPGAVGEPLRNGLAPGLLHVHSRGDSFSAGNAGLGRDNRHSIFNGLGDSSPRPRSSGWLQSGIISGLGLSVGSGSSGGRDLWGPPSKQPSSSIWAVPKHLDADAVPDSLQELWANTNANHGGSSNLAANNLEASKASLFSNRNSLDSLGSLGKDSSLSSSLGRHSHMGNGYSSNLGAIGMQSGLASQSPSFGGGFSQGYSQGPTAGLGSSVLQASQGYLQGMLEKPTASSLGLSHGYTAGLGHTSLAAAQGYSQGWGGSQGNFQSGLGAPLGYSQGLGGSQVYSQGLGAPGALPQGSGGASLGSSLGFPSGLAAGLATPMASQAYSQLGQGHGFSSQHSLGHGAGGSSLPDRLAGSQQSFGSNSLSGAGHAPMGQQQRLQDLWNHLGGVSPGQPNRPQQQLQSLAQQGLYGQQALQQQQTLQLQQLQQQQQQQQHNWQGRSSPGFSSLNVGSRLYQQ